MKPPISREELERRMMQCGGISPDDAENAAVMELFDDIDWLRGEQTPPQGKTSHLFLYRVTLKGMQSSVSGTAYGVSYVVATSTDEAYELVRTFLDTNDLGFSGDRILQKVELIASDYQYSGIGTMLFMPPTAALPVPQEVEVVAEVENGLP